MAAQMKALCSSELTEPLWVSHSLVIPSRFCARLSPHSLSHALSTPVFVFFFVFRVFTALYTFPFSYHVNNNNNNEYAGDFLIAPPIQRELFIKTDISFFSFPYRAFVLHFM